MSKKKVKGSRAARIGNPNSRVRKPSKKKK